ncbi:MULTISPECIES: hypothetical protein [Streptomyces]|uniref:hypothetical protein n=1 Tax=Streptomyces TaxID=1883 RepID=UPI001E4CE238|nr:MULTISPECIES: hypothetical protein [Streptomyces]UFQ16445.1 hypothetical protein J2N69_16330 [Streptomyces huasconensis]WCL86047.1 hypothetical protein PPN52_16340 [Streptomyces sp. JCM 35825]
MKKPDAYFPEDQPDGTEREFWVRAGGYLRHTLEIQGDRDGLELVWITDSLDGGGAHVESRASLEITTNDARKMIATLRRLIKTPH